MTAGPKQHFGLQDFNQGELRNARVHIYATLAELNAAATSAQARFAYVIETQSMYWGGPGSWSILPLDPTLPPGGGTPVDTVTDPNDLDYKRAAVAGAVTVSDDVADTITIAFAPGELDHVQIGDELVIAGSADNAATPWLDGTYEIVAIDDVTGVVTFATGAVPAVPAAPVSTYGTYTLNDLTGPADGYIAIVNPDSDPDVTLALYVYNGSTDTWSRHNDYDMRIILTDGSRAFAIIPAVAPDITDIPAAIENLVTNAYLIGQLSGYTSGPHYIVEIDSTGGNTVVTISTTDEAAVLASVGKTLRTAGTSTALDGDQTILAANWAAGVATIEVVNVAVNAAPPPGTTAIYDADQELATIEDVNSVGGDLATHIAAPDPHPQYEQAGEVNTKIATHAGEADPHSAYLTEAAIDAKVSTHDAEASAHAAAFSLHNNDPNAHSDLVSGTNVSGTRSTHTSVAVDPAVEVGQPVILDPVTEMYSEWAAGQTPQGLAQSVSEVTEIFGDLAIDFAAAGTVTMDTEAISRLDTCDVIRFPGAVTNTGWFKVRSLDLSSGVVYLRGTVALEAGVTSAMEVMSRDATVVENGILVLGSGRDVTEAIDITEITVAAVDGPSLTLDVGEEIDHLTPGMQVTVAGTTGGLNNGTYEISSVDAVARRISLALIDETISTTSNLVASVTVATKTIITNAGSDLTEVQGGDKITLAGTADNDGLYTIDTVDDGTKTIVTIEDIVGADEGATGTFTVVRENGGTPLGGADYPPVSDPIIGGLAISAITGDVGGGQGRIFFSGAPDLSDVQAGNTITVTGATDPANNDTFPVVAVDDGADHITVEVELVDQAGGPGTASVTGVPASTPATDGTATVMYADDTANNEYDSVASGAQGKTFYTDDAATHKYSDNPGLFMLGSQLTPEALFVNIGIHELHSKILTAGEVLAVGDICYLNADGEYYQTVATAAATSTSQLAVSAAVGADGVENMFYTPGAVIADGGLTPGAPQYLDASTAAGYTATAPAGSGDVVRIIGYGDANGDLLFLPDATWSVIP